MVLEATAFPIDPQPLPKHSETFLSQDEEKSSTVLEVPLNVFIVGTYYYEKLHTKKSSF